MAKRNASGYILGLDIGTNSIGWALVQTKGGKPTGIERSGVRIFEAGTEGDIASGRDSSRSTERREARLRRRQTDRSARRLSKTFHILQNAGLLPSYARTVTRKMEGAIRHDLILQLDAKIREELQASSDLKQFAEAGNFDQVQPYVLRAAALDHSLEPHQLGRAFYHLAQRRGFLSNRKSAPKKDEDAGTVKAGISELEERIGDAGARTLGEYFSKCDPEERRIRRQYTHRSMFVNEFEKIWTAQAAHHSDILTDELKKRLRKAIFYQRPLKSASHLIGECELEEGCKRAPVALPEVQRFRYLQAVNNLDIITPDGEVLDLTLEQRNSLVNALEKEGDHSFAKVRKVLGFSRYHKFNLERGGEKRMVGNRTNAKLRKVFGERWDDKMTEDERTEVLEDVRSIVMPETLKRRGLKRWGLDEQAATALSEVTLEDGYSNLSRCAIHKLLPLLEKGTHYATARKEVYGESFEAGEPLDRLPPLVDAPLQSLCQVRNPVVARALTELRKVVNAIVRKYGRPDTIRLELARDMKRPRKARKDITNRNRKNQRAREEAKRRLLEEAGIANPSRNDIQKVLLWEECECCPYTGKTINISKLVGPSPEFDIEHIIPYSRSLDDSYMNKTLCHNVENRNVKGNRAPSEAYSGERLEEIILRVQAFRGSGRIAKLRRFEMTSEQITEQFGQFTTRQLNDTRYASGLAADYLGLLYGGRIDADGTRRIDACAGQVTAILRNEWELNRILRDGPGKSRDDHRHHAVDALCVALTNAGTVQLLSKAAELAQEHNRRRFAPIDPPWEGFLENARSAIQSIVVSHRVNRRVSGAFHKDTFYGREVEALDEKGRVKKYRHVPVAVAKLSAMHIPMIVDPCVRAAIEKRLSEVGGDFKQLGDDNNPPRLPSGIPIRKVRIRRVLNTQTIGEDSSTRHVPTGANHHVEIIETAGGKSGPQWRGKIVTLYEAYQRKRNGLPVVERNHGDGETFVCSLSGGDSFQLVEVGQTNLYVVRKLSKGKIEFVRHTDARKSTQGEGQEKRELFTRSANELWKRGFRKVVIGPWGEVHPAND